MDMNFGETLFNPVQCKSVRGLQGGRDGHPQLDQLSWTWRIRPALTCVDLGTHNNGYFYSPLQATYVFCILLITQWLNIKRSNGEGWMRGKEAVCPCGIIGGCLEVWTTSCLWQWLTHLCVDRSRPCFTFLLLGSHLINFLCTCLSWALLSGGLRLRQSYWKQLLPVFAWQKCAPGKCIWFEIFWPEAGWLRWFKWGQASELQTQSDPFGFILLHDWPPFCSMTSTQSSRGYAPFP